MWESDSVPVSIHLPHELAAEVEEIQKSDPEFFTRVVRYGLTRRSVYRYLKQKIKFQEEAAPVGATPLN